MRRVAFGTLAAAIALMAATVLVSCDSEPLGGEQPKTEIFVLVDLSKTWHDPADAAKEQATRELLQEVGEGIALAADTTEPPLTAQYRVIGQDSLDRPPVCKATYLPTLISVRNGDPQRIGKIGKLKAYLGINCPRILLAGPAEPSTEISAAIASVALRPPALHGQRFIIIASDFREESTAHEPIRPKSLEGSKVLLLYRPADHRDRQTAGEMQARMESWRASLAGFGATLEAMPDSGFGRADMVRFLTSK